MNSRPESSGAAPAAKQMRDRFGRRIEYLRVSITDKCNLRCVYCMPVHGLPSLKRSELLSYEEIRDIVATLATTGLRRLRITGGEPLVRRDVTRLVRMLAEVPGIENLALSTNAVLLGSMADALRAAGLDRVNVSLDSLRPERVDAIARRAGSFREIMRGLSAAERAGLHPIKVNVVVLRGRNDDEITDFARLTLDRPWHVRFIEIMPVGGNIDLSASEYVPAPEILRRVRELGHLRQDEGPPGNGPATYFRFPGAPGSVGVITPVSRSYCQSCNRMRLTADGRLRPCLFDDFHVPLRDSLRAGDPLEPLIARALGGKPEQHHLVRGSSRGSGGLLALSQIGG